LGPRPKLTPPQHSAQRRIVGILRASGAVSPAEIIIQRPCVAFADETSAEDVAALLAVLDVATTVDEKSERAPGGRRDGDRYARVHIARSEWPRMVEVFPSLADVLDGL
jgi:hypothetical protein